MRIEEAIESIYQEWEEKPKSQKDIVAKEVFKAGFLEGANWALSQHMMIGQQEKEAGGLWV